MLFEIVSQPYMRTDQMQQFRILSFDVMVILEFVRTDVLLLVSLTIAIRLLISWCDFPLLLLWYKDN